MGSIVWNGISSRAIPLIVENPPSYVSAERDYEPQHVPGRNGDLLINSDSFQNVERSYNVAFGSTEKPHSELASAASEWLRSPRGYARLEDSYEPDYFRIAYYQEESDFENILNHLGKGTITFNCMPQRFLKSGETVVPFSLSGIAVGSYASFVLRNPTNFDSRPLIYVYGSGDIDIYIGSNQGRVAIRDLPNSILIDCEKRGYYLRSSDNKWGTWGGKYIDTELTTDVVFNPSIVNIRVNVVKGSFTKMEVVPKWYTI